MEKIQNNQESMGEEHSPMQVLENAPSFEEHMTKIKEQQSSTQTIANEEQIADKALAAATASAAKEQTAYATEEQAHATEYLAREEAQRRANEADIANQAEAKSGDNDSATKRAEMFKNGDF